MGAGGHVQLPATDKLSVAASVQYRLKTLSRGAGATGKKHGGTEKDVAQG